MSSGKTITGPMPVNHEMGDWGVDPDSGSLVRRLTSAPAWSHNYYCEQPYCSPDGRRLIVVRTNDPFCPTRQLLVADLQQWSLTLVEPAVFESFAHSPYGEWLYYQVADGSLRRVSLLTLERQEVLPADLLPVPPGGYLQSISADLRHLLYWESAAGGKGLNTCLLDLQTREKQVPVDGPGNRNPHGQFNRSVSAPQWMDQFFGDDKESRIYLRIHDLQKKTTATLPIGGTHTAESTGHMAWVGDTGRIACAVGWLREERRHDPRHPQGNLVIAGPGDREPTIYPAPKHGFWHVSVSRCGRYFVSDDFMDFRADAFVSGPPGPIRIVVGNLQTGKHRVLVRDCQDHGIAGTSRYEPDPYLTADNRYVIYNASPFGVMHVFAAQVPAGFLESLA